MRLNGVIQVVMTKDQFDKIKVCTQLFQQGHRPDHIPYDLKSADIVPVFEMMPG